MNDFWIGFCFVFFLMTVGALAGFLLAKDIYKK